MRCTQDRRANSSRIRPTTSKMPLNEREGVRSIQQWAPCVSICGSRPCACSGVCDVVDLVGAGSRMSLLRAQGCQRSRQTQSRRWPRKIAGITCSQFFHESSRPSTRRTARLCALVSKSSFLPGGRQGMRHQEGSEKRADHHLVGDKSREVRRWRRERRNPHLARGMWSSWQSPSAIEARQVDTASKVGAVCVCRVCFLVFRVGTARIQILCSLFQRDRIVL